MNENMIFEDFRTVLHYEVSLANNIGKRNEQQDTIYLAVNDRELLAVMCDGIGSLKEGRLSGIKAVQAFVNYCGDSDKSQSGWMVDAISVADEIVSQMNCQKSVPEAGTTLVSIYIMDNYLQWVSAGDSRLYIYRNGEIIRITHDHTYSYLLKIRLESGEINEKEYKEQEQFSEQLVSFVGMGGLQMVDSSKKPVLLNEDDIVFLCTDGVYRTIDDGEISNIFKKYNNAEEMGNEIVKIVEETNNEMQDNYTFAIIKIVEGAKSR